LGGFFTRYTLTAGGKLVVPVDVFSRQEIDQINYGGFLFVDAVWTEFCLSFQYGHNTYSETMSAKDTDNDTTLFGRSDKGSGTEMMLGFTLLGKYPFRLNRQVTVFPLAGLEYQIALLEYRDPERFKEYNRTDGIRESDSKGGAYALPMWNSLFIDIGAGLDYAFGSGLYMRTELLYGFRLQTLYEVDALEKVKSTVNAPDPKLAGLTSGPVLKISLGYQFGPK
jgi:hypothetical protein